MGIYYAAIDRKAKKKFESPKGHCIKYPGIFHPHNPFGQMVVMKNAQGWSFDIENDADWEGPFYDDEYENITEKVFEEFLSEFPWYKEELEAAK